MISASLVKELRDKTGAGMMDCKEALKETNGDLEKAVDYLRKSGAAKAQKKASRSAKDGVIYSYIHPGDKLGVLLELNCETDFVANTDQFRGFVKDVAMHIAATNPLVISRSQFPADVLEREKAIYSEQAAASGKPADIIEKIVNGRVEKFLAESVLLEQSFVKNPELTIEDLLNEIVSTLGENMVISRFVRFQLGETAVETASPED